MSMKCGKCRRAFAGEMELCNVFPSIPNMVERIEPGDIVPSGECPACGALVYMQDDNADVVCNVCGDAVDLADMRAHLSVHNPSADNMSWEQLRAVFTGKWDN